MSEQLPPQDFGSQHYERPNQKWICGHACEGSPAGWARAIAAIASPPPSASRSWRRLKAKQKAAGVALVLAARVRMARSRTVRAAGPWRAARLFRRYARFADAPPGRWSRRRQRCC